jgi:hypothetical protein
MIWQNDNWSVGCRHGHNLSRRDLVPLRAGQIRRVSGDSAAMLRSSSRRPHGESESVRETPRNHGRAL